MTNDQGSVTNGGDHRAPDENWETGDPVGPSSLVAPQAPWSRGGAAEGPPPQRLFGVTRPVFFLGLTSMFADVAGEMISPFIPLFMTGVLGAPVAAVGLVEGIAESTASLVKVASGWVSDRVGRRMPLVIAGYGLAAVAKLLLALAFAWPVVLAARFFDRFGKGMRGSPRDALIADATPADERGRAFGMHRALDTGGAVIGPLLALGLAALLNDQYRLVFAIAAVPGVLAVVTLFLVKEPPHTEPPRAAGVRLPPLRLDRRLQLFFAASLIFALGNSSDAFLVLRAQSLGLSTTEIVLGYVLYNFVYMAASYPAGIISDRVGRRNVYVLGLLVFAGVYCGFALAGERWLVWPLFAAYGLITLMESVVKALITDLAPADQRATALGLYGTLTGVAALFASIAAGQLWERVGVAAAFYFGAGAALVTAVAVLGILPSGRLHSTTGRG